MTQEQQSIPIAQVFTAQESNNHTNNGYDNSRLSLTQFQVDRSTSKVNFSKLGAQSIIVREDIISDLINIKKVLNEYGIPLSCDYIDIKLNNTYISDMARLGLEINLNSDSGMTRKSDLYNDDYFIAPDFNKPYGNGYRMKVYGQCRKSNPDPKAVYKQINMPIEVYDIRNTYLKSEPKLKKIFKPLIDITRIFEDYGFIQGSPNKEFIYRSDNMNSNWYIFYKPHKIKIGDTYVEHLSKVYKNSNESIWLNKNLKWNGERFNG